MPVVEIPYAEWADFCENFSLSHRGWLVNIEVAEGSGAPLVLSRDMPLRSITAEKRNGVDMIRIVAGDGAENHIAHPIPQPRLLKFQQSEQGAHEGLNIVSADGTTTSVRFRSPAHPECVDGFMA